MKRRVLLILFILSCTVSVSKAVSFRATAPKTVIAGQQFRITYTCNEEGTNFNVGAMSGLDVIFGPAVSTSESVQIINGHTSSQSSYSYIYTVIAPKAGSFRIPAASIRVRGSVLHSNSLTVKVLPKGQGGSGNGFSGGGGSSSGNGGENDQSQSESLKPNGIFVKVNVSNKSVYKNEGFLVTFKLYSLYNCGLDYIKFPDFNGFIAQDLPMPTQPEWSLENYNGRNYRTVVLKKTVLFPQKSGKLVIPAGQFNSVIRLITREKMGGGSFFDSYFESYRDVRKILHSSPLTIDVKPLPANAPLSYTGAVGHYSMTSSINRKKLRANESLNMKIVISGNGNIKLLSNPNIKFPLGFDTFDPKTDVKTNITAGGVSGTKTVEYNLIPRDEGDYTIPAAEFSYFDPSTGSYKKLYTQEFKIHVSKGLPGTGGVYHGKQDSEAAKYAGKDIFGINKGKPTFKTLGSGIFFGSVNYWLLYIVPALAFILLFILYKKRIAENANLVLLRTKKASKVATKRLKRARKFLKNNKREEFYEEVLKALWGYLSDKLSIPVADLTKENMEAEMDRFGIDENLSKDFMDIMNDCEFARYSPVKDAHEMSNIYDSAAKAIDGVENLIRKQQQEKANKR